MPTKNEISEFSELINDLADSLGITRMDAIAHHCETTGLEIDVAATLISSALKSKIREEAENLNLLKRNSKLPI